jgi:hypothetical protein
MSELNRFTRNLWDIDTPNYFNDFASFATATGGVSSLAADAGTSVAAGATRNGVVVCTTGATDNNEAGVSETNARLTLLAGKPITGRLFAQFAEANTDDANVFLGIASGFGANLLVDDGAGPRASGTILGFYKVDGATVWHVYTRSNGVVTDTITNITAGTSDYHEYTIEVKDYDTTTVEVVFLRDGKPVRDANNVIIPAVRVAVASATIASVCAYVKAGSANSEVLNVDWLYSAQKR